MGMFFMRILNMSLTASVIILCVMAARLLLKKAPKIFSYALWSVVLFRLLCPVSLTAPVSVLEVTKPQVAESGAVSWVAYESVENVAVETGTIAPRVQTEPVSVKEIQERQADPKPTLLEIASYLWLAGMAVMVLHSAAAYFRLYRKLVGAMCLRNNIYVADHIGSPFVMGIFRPKIYLPSNIPMKERSFIIAHERHHIRRGDHIIKLLAYFALCIHWFNPLVWAAFILAGKDMEMSCDEAVIKKLGEHIRADYSASLLRLATGRKIIAGTPLAFGEGDTKGRVLNMANWKKPKIWVSILCVAVCIVILVACAVNPEQEIEEPAAAQLSDDPLERCKQVVESVQNSDGYRILTERQNFGENVVNDTSRIRDWKAGDNWLQINKVPEDAWMSYFAYLYRDGVYYDNMSSGGRDENGHILWEISTDQGNLEPWLATFQWGDEKVELLSVENVEEEHAGTFTVVHLAVQDTLKLGSFATEAYTVDFRFDSEGDFYCAALTADFPADGFGFTNTMYLQTLDAASVAQEIEAYFQGIPTSLAYSAEGNTVTYGDFTMTLPDGYSYRESQGAGLVLTKDGEAVGGITHWRASDLTLNGGSMAEWVRALGLLEAMGDEAYMIDGWSGNYLTAFYIDELDPRRLNVYHHFFQAEELVYDIWFDNNVLSDGIAMKFLETAYIGGEPTVVTKTEEEAASEAALFER